MRTLFLAIFFIQSISAQDLIPYLSKNLYGYSDMEGNIVITPQFDEVGFFDKYGLAIVKKQNQDILLAKNGKKISSFEAKDRPLYYSLYSVGDSRGFRMIDTIHHLRVIRYYNNLYQIINIQNYECSDVFVDISKLILSMPKFDLGFTNGYYLGQTVDNQYQLIDLEVKTVCSKKKKVIERDSLYRRLHSFDNEAHQFVQECKRNFFEVPDSINIVSQINDSILIYCKNNGIPSDDFRRTSLQPKPMGLIFKGGKLISPLKFTEVRKVNPEYLLVKENKKYYFTTFNASPISDKTYNFTYFLNDSILFAKNATSSYFIQTKNLMFFDIGNIEKMKYISKDNYYIGQSFDKFTVFNEKLQLIFEGSGQDVEWNRKHNLFLIKIDGFYGVFDKDKNTIIAPRYDRIALINNHIMVYKGSKSGLYSINGKSLFEPIYENIYINYKGIEHYYSLKKDGFYGFYDSKLNQICDFVSKKYYFSDSPSAIKIDNNIFQIENPCGEIFTIEGQKIFFFKTNKIERYQTLVLLPDSTLMIDKKIIEGLKVVYSLDNKYPIINENKGLIAVSDGSRESVINLNEDFIIPFDNHHIQTITDHLIVTEKNSKYDVYSNEGQPLHLQQFDYVNIQFNNNLILIGINIPNKTYKFILDTCLYKRKDTLILHHKRYGYMSLKGKIIVPPIYNDVQHSYKNLYSVSLEFEDGEKKSFILDSLGNELLTVPYDRLEILKIYNQPYFFIAHQKNRIGLLNSKGEQIFPCTYKTLYFDNNSNLFRAQDHNGNHFLFNLAKNNITHVLNAFDTTSQYSINKLPYDLFYIHQKNKVVIFDINGQKRFDFIADELNIEYDFLLTNTPDLLKLINNNLHYYFNLKNLVVYKAIE